MDLREDSNTIEKLAKNKQRPLYPESAEKLGRELRAVKYVECSALTQVWRATSSHRKQLRQQKDGSQKHGASPKPLKGVEDVRIAILSQVGFIGYCWARRFRPCVRSVRGVLSL